MVTGHGEELALGLEPYRQWINPYGVARHARHEHIRTLLVLNGAAKKRRHFESALVVDSGRSATSEALLLHLRPLESTRIVRRSPWLVNRNLLNGHNLRSIFAKASYRKFKSREVVLLTFPLLH